jgi:hypothetical protein
MGESEAYASSRIRPFLVTTVLKGYLLKQPTPAGILLSYWKGME